MTSASPIKVIRFAFEVAQCVAWCFDKTGAISLPALASLCLDVGVALTALGLAFRFLFPLFCVVMIKHLEMGIRYRLSLIAQYEQMRHAPRVLDAWLVECRDIAGSMFQRVAKDLDRFGTYLRRRDLTPH